MSKIINWLRKYGIRYTLKKLANKFYTRYLLGPWKVNRRITATERKRQEEEFATQNAPCISIVVPLFNTPEVFLREMIDSVCQQTYGNWQLCMADGSDEDHAKVGQICQTYATADQRICYQKLEKNQGISENTNACLAMAGGDYIGLFDHDDLLHPSALYEVVKTICDENADVVYTDEATFCGREGRLLSVHVKPDFFMNNLRANNYICHFTVFRKSLLDNVGGFRKEYDGSQDHDLMLRLCEKAEIICHIPKVLYFWRAHQDSVALHTGAKEYVVEAGCKAVEDHLRRCHVPAEVKVVTEGMFLYDIMYQYKTINWHEVVFVNGEKFYEPDKKAMERIRMQLSRPEVVAVVPRVWDGKKTKDVPGYMNRLLYAQGMEKLDWECVWVKKEALEKWQETYRNGDKNCVIYEPRVVVKRKRKC